MSSEFRLPFSRPEDIRLVNASTDFRFAVAVAEFGLLLRESAYAGAGSIEQVVELASDAVASDSSGYRAEFMELVQASTDFLE